MAPAAPMQVSAPNQVANTVKVGGYIPSGLGAEDVLALAVVKDEAERIEAFLDHGMVSRSVDEDLEGAQAILTGLADAGIDLKAVTDQLEEEGIASIIKSFETLLAGDESKRAALASR